MAASAVDFGRFVECLERVWKNREVFASDSTSVSPDLEASYPHLFSSGYNAESNPTDVYNCIAFAAGDVNSRWEDSGVKGVFWPPVTGQVGMLESLVEAFRWLGYDICSHGRYEIGYQKVALFASPDGEWTHAAKRRLIDGQWISKCGNGADIIHSSLDCFRDPTEEYNDYGRAVIYIRRPCLRRIIRWINTILATPGQSP